MCASAGRTCCIQFDKFDYNFILKQFSVFKIYNRISLCVCVFVCGPLCRERRIETEVTIIIVIMPYSLHNNIHTFKHFTGNSINCSLYSSPSLATYHKSDFPFSIWMYATMQLACKWNHNWNPQSISYNFLIHLSSSSSSICSYDYVPMEYGKCIVQLSSHAPNRSLWECVFSPKNLPTFIIRYFYPHHAITSNSSTMPYQVPLYKLFAWYSKPKIFPCAFFSFLIECFHMTSVFGVAFWMRWMAIKFTRVYFSFSFLSFRGNIFFSRKTWKTELNLDVKYHRRFFFLVCWFLCSWL